MISVVWAEPQLEPAVTRLVEEDGTIVKTYSCMRSWHRIQHVGRWWRLNGRDRSNGDYIMLAEAV